MDKFPFLGSSHTSLIEKMYEDYLKDSSSVHKEWRDFFQGYNFAKEVEIIPHWIIHDGLIFIYKGKQKQINELDAGLQYKLPVKVEKL